MIPVTPKELADIKNYLGTILALERNATAVEVITQFIVTKMREVAGHQTEIFRETISLVREKERERCALIAEKDYCSHCSICPRLSAQKIRGSV